MVDQRRQSFLVHMYGTSAADFDLYRALFPLRVTQTASPSEGHSERTRSPAAPPRSRAASARAPTCQTLTPASGPRDASGIPGRLPAQSSLRRLMVVREGEGEESGFGQNFEQSFLSMKWVGVNHRTTPKQTSSRDSAISSTYGF